MNEELNPYASPQSLGYLPSQTLTVEVVESGGPALFRKGKLLVMHKQAAMPDRCIKSNWPAQGRRLKRSLYWHHPAVYFAVLLNLLIYIILALILRKQATIYVGLSEEWSRRRRWAIFWGWTLFLGGVAAGITAITCADRYPMAAWGILLGFATAIGGAIYGLVVARLVTPTRITDDFIWLKGVHPDFLASLPPWPYHP